MDMDAMGWIKYFILKLTVTVLDIVTNFILGWWHRNVKKVPPVSSSLLMKPAIELAEMIRNKQLKCLDLMTAYIDRIVEIQGIINAVVDQRFQDALVEAQQADLLIESGRISVEELMKEKPFFGIPLSVKESIALKGMSHSIGLLCRKDVKADKDADVVKAMKKAGAIPVVSTNVPEICLWIESSNNLYGCTKNPYNTARCAGGSSGGEGALIGAAGSVFGIGTDIGGSIRIPSLYNGIFGHKPTSGIVSNEGVYPPVEGDSLKFRCTGPMCRYAVDLLPMLRVLVGSNNDKLNLHLPVELKNLRVYYMENDGTDIYPVASDINKAQKKVLDHLENICGTKPQKVFLTKLKHSFNILAAKISMARKIPVTAELADRKGEISVITEFVKWCLCYSSHTIFSLVLCLFSKQKSNFDKCGKILKQYDLLKAEMEEILGDNGVFLYPTLPGSAPYHYQTLYKLHSIGYCGIFNILGFPVTHCPLGLDKNGLPIGIQVVAGPNNDRLTISMAIELEKAFGGWVNPAAS